MIYLIGGAPRVGKTTLSQQLSSRLKAGWISTDILYDVVRFKNDDGPKIEWNASPEAITRVAEWFYPYLKRFIWSISSMAKNYVIEGVSFLPAQVSQLAEEYPICTVFLGCSQMTLERLDQFPGHSKGYGGLRDEMRRQIVVDVPLWSEYIRQKCEGSGYRYVDMADDFPRRLREAESVLMGDE